MAQKTIKEWLETLPEPYRGEALENVRSYNAGNLDHLAHSLCNALSRAFEWRISPQKRDYWDDVFVRAMNGEFDGAQDAAHESAHDKQIGGSHYKDMKIQPSDFIRANGIGWYEANAIKYICRHQSKGGKQDIEKAIHYLEMIIQEYDSNTRN